MNNYKILYNFPTRLRPGKFFSAVNNIRSLSTNEIDYLILAKIDDDDFSMQTSEVNFKLHDLFEAKTLFVAKGLSNNKIHAVNRGIGTCPYDWDIMVTM